MSKLVLLVYNVPPRYHGEVKVVTTKRCCNAGVPGNDLNGTCQWIHWRHEEKSTKTDQTNSIQQFCKFATAIDTKRDCFVCAHCVVFDASRWISSWFFKWLVDINSLIQSWIKYLFDLSVDFVWGRPSGIKSFCQSARESYVNQNKIIPTALAENINQNKTKRRADWSTSHGRLWRLWRA